MNPFFARRRSFRLQVALLGSLLLAVAPQLAAQSAAGGTVEGVVVSAATGKRLEHARITVEGTQLEDFTDADGHYRVNNVPPGTATLRAFFTGLAPQSDRVTVATRATARLDFNLSAGAKSGAASAAPVQLSQFVVEETRQMDAAAIAINEQRFAPNIKNVIAAGEFGSVADGDVGELLKLTPGITVEYAAGDARRVGLDGVPSDNTPVTIGGFNLAHTVQGTTTRGVELNQVSLNNMARIEVIQSPTPESPGMALAGSINMVRRSAFEYSKPQFSVSTYVTMNEQQLTLGKTPGQRGGPARAILPGYELAVTVPVNDRWGFSISSSGSNQYSPRNSTSATWRGVTSATNGTTLPDTTPDKPYLSGFSWVDGPFMRYRYSIAATVDYKVSPYDRLSFAIDRTYFGSASNNHTMAFNLGTIRPGDFSLTSVHGAPGTGSATITTGEAERDAYTLMPTLTYRHTGQIWAAEAGAGYSFASDRLRNADKGFFQSVSAQRAGLTIAFDDISYLRPGRITVTDAAGAPVDPYNIANYALNTASASEAFAADGQRSIYANLKRSFEGKMPFTLKGGIDVANSIRDIRQRPGALSLTYVGADGRTSTAPAGGDDSAAPYFDSGYVGRRVQFGFPESPGMRNTALLAKYRSNPGYFTGNEATSYQNLINASKRAEETITSAYVRGDTQFFQGRLKLIGGVRAEQTNDKGEGPLTDPSRNYQRDASGRVILASGRPVNISNDPLTIAKLTRIDRGNHVDKEYLRLFPSLNASFNLRENLIARAAYYTSVGRPDFNQYVGPLTLPDVQALPGTNNRITVNNAGIKAWSAQSFRASLEYYFENVGLLSVGAFHRDFENFFGARVFDATPEFLALYGLDPAIYGNYQVSTQYNVPGKVRMDGFNVNYKQALTFLPHWARGVQVFGNASVQRATGDEDANFAGFLPKIFNWGVSLNRERFELRVNWNYRARARVAGVSGRSIEDGTFNWTSKRLYVDVSGEYRFLRHYSVFFKMRNLDDATEDTKTFGPHTPARANLRSRVDFGSLWTLGVNAKF